MLIYCSSESPVETILKQEEAFEMIQRNINYLKLVLNDKTHRALSASMRVCVNEKDSCVEMNTVNGTTVIGHYQIVLGGKKAESIMSMYEKHCPFSGASEFRIQDNCFDFGTA